MGDNGVMSSESKGDETVGSRIGLVGFFMHIPKTAGSYVNHIFRHGLGEHFVEDLFVEHLEIDSRLNTEADVILCSGHVYLEPWLRLEAQRGWKVKNFTLLREPLAQLASHILWLDHYAESAYLPEYRDLDAETRRVIDEIAATDLADAGDVDRLLVNLSGHGIMYLDNCQARYFLADGKGVECKMPLHLGMRTRLNKALDQFSFVGTGENIKKFVESVSHELDIKLTYLDKKVNEAKAGRRIDLTDPEIRSVLSKRVTLDTWLYNTVKFRW